MDDPGLSWPYWKFGLKSDDLFTKLHDQYNTFPSSIQDPEAFHHDVYELSSEATTLDEFNRLMSDRKAQRLHELNGMLESASLEIIANPDLIGTVQWQHALQLFRTKSLDSLVRYFASYIPLSHPWHRASGSDISSSPGSESVDDYYGPRFFDDGEDERVVMDEPKPISTTFDCSHLPPSPRSMTMCSEGSADSSTDFTFLKYKLSTITPARTLSISESASERFASLQDSIPTLQHDEETSQSDDPLTPTSSVSDMSEFDGSQGKDTHATDIMVGDVVHDGRFSAVPTTQRQLYGRLDSETPTPKPQETQKSGSAAPANSFFDTKLSSLRHRSLSPMHTPYPHHVHACLPDCRKSHASMRQLRRRDCSPDGGRRRKSPVEGASRVQKPLLDTSRSRPRGRRPVVQ